MPRTLGLLWLFALAVGLAWPWPPANPAAQEQFTTQSGGRGVANARTNARLSKAEQNVTDLQIEMAKVKPHAKSDILTCIEEGNKLRWDGTSWTCSRETDPTVQPFAKQALPTCGDGRQLSVIGGALGCSTASFVTVESDPTVQAFAKEALPVCSNGLVLTTTADGKLSCSADLQGVMVENDPKVHDFARTDKVSFLPNCAATETLTMVGGRLQCRLDLGLTVESDPRVQNFARNDIEGYSLGACANGELLKAVTLAGKVVLRCDSADAALGEVLNLTDLADVDTAGQVVSDTLVFDGIQWRPQPQLGSSANPLFLSQLGDVQIATPLADEVLRFDGSRWVNSNDKLGTLTDTHWCRVVGSDVVCDLAPPLNCSASEILTWNFAGNQWQCEDVGSKVGGALELNDLGDVTITTVANGQVLRFDGTGWVNQTLERVLAGDTQVLVTDSGVDGTVTLATEGQSRVMVDANGRVGVGVVPVSPYMLDVSGSVRSSGALVAASGNFSGNLSVAGNLNVSGSQSLDGVMFANGGIQMPGTLAGGAVSVTNISGTVGDIRTLRVANSLNVAGTTGLADLTAVSTTLNRLTVDTDALVRGTLRVTGNLNVSGSQTIDGVLFANGGIQMPGTLQAGRISVTDISGSVADLVTLRAGTARLNSVSVTNNLTVAGNLDVLGNQSIGGVLFANGGIQLGGTVVSGAVSATNVSATVADIQTLRVATQAIATNVSVTNNLSVAGALTAASAGFGPVAATNVSVSRLDAASNVRVSGTTWLQDLFVRGNLNVSGSQVIDGVSFANGGVNATGTVTATMFVGSGAGLTNLPAGGVTAAGVSGSVQFKGVSGEMSGTTSLVFDAASQRLDVTGLISTTNLKLATTGAETCIGSTVGTMRFNSATGRLQVCRP